MSRLTIDTVAAKADRISRLMGDGYCVPWALMADEDTGEVVIRGDYTWHPRPGGTAQAHIERRPDLRLYLLNRVHIYTRPPEDITRAMVEWDAEPVYAD